MKAALKTPSLLLLLLFVGTACAQPGAPANESATDAPRAAQPPAAVAKPALPVLQVDEARALGSDAATLAIVEFADYQCSYCRAFHFNMLPRIKKAYIDTGKLRYFYKDLPLRTHPQAYAASVAAHCAGEQGQFWSMHQRLYAEQAQLKQTPFSKFAAELGLNTERFEACARGAAARTAVNRDLADARRLGITATPTILLGRLEGNVVTVERMATGAPAFEVIAREIDALLH